MNFVNLPNNVHVVNHRYSGFLTNYFRIRSQYFRSLYNTYPVKLTSRFFPSFGFSLVKPLPYSLISEFAYVGVPLIALVDSAEKGIENIFYPIISSEISLHSAFIILRFALKKTRLKFSLFPRLGLFFSFKKKKKLYELKSFLRRKFWRKNKKFFPITFISSRRRPQKNFLLLSQFSFRNRVRRILRKFYGKRIQKVKKKKNLPIVLRRFINIRKFKQLKKNNGYLAKI